MKETVLEAKHGSLLSFSWLYNSFGNHIKSGAGYSIGAGVAGVTSLHSEPPIQGNQPLITLPLSPKPTEAYTGHATQHWRHNHSYFLAHYVMPDGLTERLIAYRPNGNDIRFIEEDGIFVAQANRDWRITKELNDDSIQIGWRLAVGNLTEHYDSAGRILRIEDISGHSLTYTYHVDGTQQKSITDENGSTLSLNYADGQLAEVIQNQNTSYQFEYYADGMLKSITFPGNDSPKKTYLYEDPRFPGALTSVIDESGNMYSNYTYDSQGRAVRTEYSYGTNSVNVDYIDNNTRRITNALGKKTTYHFSDIGNSLRITSIEGEASANCVASHKSYTYNEDGFVASETDWEGNTTVYTRDDLGRELSRTEASGTPSERTTITEWYSDLNLPAKITTPESVTTYSYDENDRLLSKQIEPISGL